MRHLLRFTAIALFAILQSGCGSASEPTTTQASSPTLRRLPAEMRVRQRTTTRVPGSERSLQLTVDDITRGQVMVSLSDRDGKPVLSPISMKSGNKATFKLGEESYQLELTQMDNSLTGEDLATFVISSAPANSRDADPKQGSVSETEVIERLLAAIAAAEDTIFIRNGQEHPAKEAADHLRIKWKAAGGEIATAEDFIDKIASKSTISGEPYRVRRPDGTEVESAEYLREKLKEIEASR